MGDRGVRRAAGPLLALVLVTVGACAEPNATDPQPSPVPSTSVTAADPEQALRDACSPWIPADADIRPLTLEGATDGRIQAVEFPSTGRRAALVLLPQLGGGVCGWGPFAHAAARLGFPSIVIAPCLYGDSTCSARGDADPLNEVAPALEAARSDFRTERVVLMGASMGGSLTVLAAAAGADADTWIDVSGPSAWEEQTLLSVSGSLPAGGLVVQARSDGAAAYVRARLLATRSGARFLDGGSGHGYELLTRLDGRITRVGRVVLAHAKG